MHPFNSLIQSVAIVLLTVACDAGFAADPAAAIEPLAQWRASRANPSGDADACAGNVVSAALRASFQVDEKVALSPKCSYLAKCCQGDTGNAGKCCTGYFSECHSAPTEPGGDTSRASHDVDPGSSGRTTRGS